MNKIPNRAVMCEVLKEAAAKDPDVVVLCSDSRGSASLTSFADTYPEQFVEVGIAEQNLVSIAAGLASCGKKPFAASPASFITTRSYEQCKVDCAYSDTNVKLIGISGGVSYGALGMTHHSAQDIAAMSAIPGMRVYLPSDRHQTRKLFEALLKDDKTAYIRLGRNPVEDVYEEGNVPFEMDKATVVAEGTDVLIVACGEMVRPAVDAADRCLRRNGPAGGGCRCAAEGTGNFRRRAGYVLRQTAGSGKPAESGGRQEAGCNRGRARAFRRPGQYGCPGNQRQRSETGHQPGPAGYAGNYRNIKAGL